MKTHFEEAHPRGRSKAAPSRNPLLGRQASTGPSACPFPGLLRTLISQEQLPRAPWSLTAASQPPSVGRLALIVNDQVLQLFRDTSPTCKSSLPEVKQLPPTSARGHFMHLKQRGETVKAIMKSMLLYFNTSSHSSSLLCPQQPSQG